MTGERILDVIEGYRQVFVGSNIGKIDYPHDELLYDKIHGLEHCHGMLDKMIEFLLEGRTEKVFRWLGFIQGVLWANQFYTLTDLKNHNKPDEKEAL